MNNTPQQFYYWTAWIKYVLYFMASIVGVFLIDRMVLLILFWGKIKNTNPNFSITKLFFTGFRFDITVACYLALPLILISMILLCIPPIRDKVFHFSRTFLIAYSTLMLSLVAVFCIVDYYFYQFFKARINVLFFSFIEDDTQAVWQFIYKDYPIFTVIISIIILIVLFFFLSKKIFKQKEIKPSTTNSLLFKISTPILFYICFFLALRGTLPTPKSYPLKQEDANISSNSIINSLCLNPVFCFKDAWLEFSKSRKGIDMDNIGGTYHIKDLKEALQIYYGDSTQGSYQNLYATTPTNDSLAAIKPNVIFIQMESMSNQYFDFQNDSTFDLLGNLKNELPQCYLFRNFIANNIGTIESLEGLVINTVLPSVAQSTHMAHSFEGSCALPFYKNGYTTTFISGAKLNWRNLSQFLPHQYFQSLEGNTDIASHIHGTKENEWGAYDEFLFKRVWQKLNEKENGQFMYVMSTSNHPRYVLPDDYKGQALILPNEVKQMISTDTLTALKNFRGYQYANNQLAWLLHQIIHSKYATNTMVVITGDHPTLQLFDYTDNNKFYKMSVPCIIYLPKKLQPKSEVDTQEYGSHKDIFPTIYNATLSNTQYLNLGNNLFGKHTHNFGINIYYNFIINQSGAADIKSGNYFQWLQNKKYKYLQPASEIVKDSMQSIVRKAQAYMYLANYYQMMESTKK